ncbi:MAG: Ig-like domain-containing protein, partial [Spirochaetaceae bacterium]|nr:Ig-like domain-containing protein [Spirochaetaceae bacterium]
GESDTTNNCSVSVKVDVVAQQRRVDISPRTLTFEAVGDSETVTVRILDENGDEDTDASFTWISIYSPGRKCCTLQKVDDGLKVTMTKAGTMRVDLFSTDAKTARLQVTASQKATSLEVSPNSVSLEVDGTDTLSATVKDANGNAIEGRTIYWTTSDSEVATVEGADAGGETGATATVTAAATGTATITARHAVAITGTAAVTVTSSNEN